MDQLRAVDALSSGWLAGVLLLALGIVAWVNMVSPKQWPVLARSFGALRLGKHRLREDLDMRDRTLTGLVVLSTVVIAMFAYQVLLYRGWIGHGFVEFGRVLLVVTVVSLAQVAFLRAISLLPATDGGTEEYLYTVILMHVVMGLFLLPVVTVMSFPWRVAWREWAWIVGVAIIILTILFRWIRAATIGVGNGVPLRYIFIYLCALEILPFGLAIEYARHFVPPSPHL
ncbi:MAG: DUF4271 domain-containing protein [Flavobacteriales bacterium]